MLNIVYAIVGAVFMVLMALFAFLKGGAPERIGAGGFLLAWFASLVVQEEVGFRGFPIGIFLIDLATFLVFALIAWRYRRSWSIWAGGLQLIAVVGQIMIHTNPNLPMGSIYTVVNLTSYLIIICISVGTFWAWQERKAAAEYELGRNS